VLQTDERRKGCGRALRRCGYASQVLNGSGREQ
jgi:hypothetical protein